MDNNTGIIAQRKPRNDQLRDNDSIRRYEMGTDIDGDTAVVKATANVLTLHEPADKEFTSPKFQFVLQNRFDLELFTEKIVQAVMDDRDVGDFVVGQRVRVKKDNADLLGIHAGIEGIVEYIDPHLVTSIRVKLLEKTNLPNDQNWMAFSPSDLEPVDPPTLRSFLKKLAHASGIELVDTHAVMNELLDILHHPPRGTNTILLGVDDKNDKFYNIDVLKESDVMAYLGKMMKIVIKAINQSSKYRAMPVQDDAKRAMNKKKTRST